MATFGAVVKPDSPTPGISGAPVGNASARTDVPPVSRTRAEVETKVVG